MSEECGNCKFWMERSDRDVKMGGGYCRRFPPSFPSGLLVTMTKHSGQEYAVENESRMNDAWPMVHQQSWCGEYRLKPPE